MEFGELFGFYHQLAVSRTGICAQGVLQHIGSAVKDNFVFPSADGGVNQVSSKNGAEPVQWQEDGTPFTGLTFVDGDGIGQGHVRVFGGEIVPSGYNLPVFQKMVGGLGLIFQMEVANFSIENPTGPVVVGDHNAVVFAERTVFDRWIFVDHGLEGLVQIVDRKLAQTVKGR